MGRTCQGRSRGIRRNWCGLIERRGYRMTCQLHGCFLFNVLSNSFLGSTKGKAGLLQGLICRLFHVPAMNHPLWGIGWRWFPGNGGLVIKGPMDERAADPACLTVGSAPPAWRGVIFVAKPVHTVSFPSVPMSLRRGRGKGPSRR